MSNKPFDDDAFLFSCVFIFFFILQNLCSGLAYSLVKILKFFFPEKFEEKNEGNTEFFLFRLLNVLINAAITLASQILNLIVQIVWILFPVLVIVLFLSILYSNYPYALRMIETSYNSFLADSGVIRSIKRGVWVLKLVSELVLPIFNYLIDTLIRVFSSIVFFVLDDSGYEQDAYKIFGSLTLAVTEVGRGVTTWGTMQVNCRFENWQESLSDTDCLQPYKDCSNKIQCLQYETRELNLVPALVHVKAAMQAWLVMTSKICPVLTPISQVLLYPLTSRELIDIVQAVINFVITLAWDVVDITQLRCRAVSKLGRSTTYCVPDLMPIFHRLERIIVRVGDLFDAWLENTNLYIFSTFMENVGVGRNNHDEKLLTESKIKDFFGSNEVKMIRMTSSLVAYTDGLQILYVPVSATSQSEIKVQSFSRRVSLKFGLAPVQFTETILDMDVDGSYTTSLLGCSCEDNNGLEIKCSISRYSPSDELQDSKDMDVLFDQPSSATTLRCDTARIFVEATRFPQVRNFATDQERKNVAESYRALAERCRIDPSDCNDMDAMIYVVPICESSFSSTDVRTAPCIDNLNYHGCYPYCAGVYYSNSGSAPVSIFGQDVLENGFFRKNVACGTQTSAVGAESEVCTSLAYSIADQSDIDDLDLSVQQKICNYAASVCNFDVDVNSVQPKIISGGNSALAGAGNSQLTRVFLGDLQPFLVAGDQIMVSTNTNTDDVWTTQLYRLTSSVQGNLRMTLERSRIPTTRSTRDTELIPGMVFYPTYTNDFSRWQRMAAQSRYGIFYAANPAMFYIYSDLAGTEFEETARNLYKSKVFFVSPIFECAGGAQVQTSIDGIRYYQGEAVTTCSEKMTREVKFEGDDRFLTVEEMRLKVEANTHESANLYIEDVEFFNEKNILVSVRYGKIRYLKRHFSREIVEDDPGSHTVFYFVDTETLAVKRNMVFESRDSEPLKILPAFGNLWSESTMVATKFLGAISNDFVLNLFGVAQDLAVSGPTRIQGHALHHGSYPSNRKLLSLSETKKQFDVFITAIDTTTIAAFRYVGLFLGIDAFTAQVSQNALLVAVSTSQFAGVQVRTLFAVILTLFTALLNSVYFAFYVWEEIILRFIESSLQALHKGSAIPQFSSIINNVFWSVINNRFRLLVLTPSESLCRKLSHLVVDSSGPTGQLILHSCFGLVETTFTSVKILSSLYVLSETNACICSISAVGGNEQVRKKIVSCVQNLPKPLRVQYEQTLLRGIDGSDIYDKRMCGAMLNAFKNSLMKAPETLNREIALSLRALKNVPLEAMHVFGLGTTSYERWSCTESLNGRDSEITSMIPKPISAFGKCAFTTSCRVQKCSLPIELFQQERLLGGTRAATLHSQTFDNLIPIVSDDIVNLENRRFKPLAVQDYGSSVGCDRKIVIVGSPIVEDSGDKLTLQTLCYYYDITDGEVFELQGPILQLAGTEKFRYSEQLPLTEQGNINAVYNVIQDIQLPHVLADGVDATVLIMAWGVDFDFNGVYRIDVKGSQQNHGWVLQSNDFFVSLQCPQLLERARKHENLEEGDVFEVMNEADDYELSQKIENKPVFETIMVRAAERNADDYSLVMKFSFMARYQRLSAGGRRNEDGITYNTRSNIVYRKKFKTSVYLGIRDGNFQTPQICIVHMDTGGAANQGLASLQSLITRATERNNALVTFTTGKTNHSNVLLSIDLETDVITAEKVLFTITNDSDISVSSRVWKRYSAPSVNFDKVMNRGRWNDNSNFKFYYRSNMDSSLKIQRFRKMTPDGEDFESIFCVPGENTRFNTWLKTTMLQQPVTSKVGIRQRTQVKVSGKCDYMHCSGCANTRVQRLCYAAQSCAIKNCIGTVYNPNNAFCVAGSMISEIIEFYEKRSLSFWYGGVELYMNIYQAAVNGHRQSVSFTMAELSNFYVTFFCEAKDVLSTLSAFPVSIVTTIFELTAERVSTTSDAFGISDRQKNAVRNFFSPLQSLQRRTLAVSISDLIYQIALGPLHFFFLKNRLVLCFADKLADISGGYLNIVDNRVGVENDLCDIDLTSENGIQGKTDNEIILQRVQEDAIVSYEKTVEVENFFDEEREKFTVIVKDFITAGMMRLALRWKSSYEKILLGFTLNTFIDWLVGLMGAIARVLTLVEPYQCHPAETAVSSVAQCVCNDTQYVVNALEASKNYENGSFWCSGPLKMINSVGNVQYVFNRHSFLFLKASLDSGKNSLLMQSLKCEGTACVTLKMQVDSLFPEFSMVDVNPLAVLTRCRENFGSKTWDVGAFALYNKEIQESVEFTTGISVFELERYLSKISDIMDPSTIQCLWQGPREQNIQSCMSTFRAFNLNRQTEFGSGNVTAFEQFAYVKDTSQSAFGERGHDACSFLSTPSFVDVEAMNVGKSIQRCMDTSVSVCSDDTVAQATCSMIMNTMSVNMATQSNVILVNEVVSDSSHARQMLDYRDIQQCAVSAIDSEITRFSNDANILSDVQFIVNTKEMDRIHQMMDFVFMGAYNSTRIMPADVENRLFSMIYTRNENETSRSVQLPCAPVFLNDTTSMTPRQIELETCGSDARISAIAYVIDLIKTKTMEENARRESIIQRKVIQTLQNMRSEYLNLSKYMCNDDNKCCKSQDDLFCNSYSSQFDIDFDITLEEFAADLVDKIQYRAINDVTVS